MSGSAVKGRMQEIGAVRALALLTLAAVACGRPDLGLSLGEPEFAGSEVRVEILLGDGLDPQSVEVWLDGAPVGADVAAVPGGLVAQLATSAGPHRIAARAQARDGDGGAWDALAFVAPPPLPDVVSSDPLPGGSVEPDAWLRLHLLGSVAPESLASLDLACDGVALGFDAELLSDGGVAVNPDPALPADAACALVWRGEAGVESLAFVTAPLGTAVEALYDRRRDDVLTPFPDDFYQDDAADTPTGRRLALPVPAREGLVPALFDALIRDTRGLDGWSPLAPLVVETSAPLDPGSLPATPEASLDPLATVQLLDLDAGARRVPFRAQVRSDATDFGVSHTLLVFPARPLDARGRYALVLTRRVRSESGSPLAPSAFFTAALAEPAFADAPELARVRARLALALAVLEVEAEPRLPREDLALLLPITIRSTDALSRDALAMRAAVDAAPPPELLGFVVEPETTPGSPLAAVVRGTWAAPDWRPREPGLGPLERGNLVRDADGLPVVQGTRPVEFVLALPAAAADRPVPLVMHQHGNPGGLDEVVAAARDFLAEAGFATIGFTDVVNREVAPAGDEDGRPRTPEERIELQVSNIFLSLFVNRMLPEHWLETTGEQLAFLRFLDGLADLDVLPLGAPDGVPDVDLALPLAYHGISEGANHGQALLAYAPEIRAAALVVGGARLVEALVHQQADAFLTQLPSFVPGLVPSEIWVGVSLFQSLYDAQDRHNQLAHVYRDRLEIHGNERPASVLLIEGLGDTRVPNGATESAAWALGLPQLEPLRPVPFLDSALAPLRANLDAETTGGLVQYAPVGVPGVPSTPGCARLPAASASEGHFCAQSAPESQRLRADFFRSALDGAAPEIGNPSSQ